MEKSEVNIGSEDSSPLIAWNKIKKFWMVGTFENPRAELTLGIGWRLDKNSTTDCLEVMLTRGDKTMGYVLVELLGGTLALRGMTVYDELRGKGLASLLIALWLKLCVELKLPAATKKIDKPVISLMLQKFGFVPCSTKTEVEVGAEAGAQGEVVLWSADAVQLRATFSKRYLKTQNMVIADECPENSRTVWVNTAYSAPSMEILQQHLDTALQNRLLCFYSTRTGEGFAEFIQAQVAHLPAFHAKRSSSGAVSAGHSDRAKSCLS